MTDAELAEQISSLAKGHANALSRSSMGQISIADELQQLTLRADERRKREAAIYFESRAEALDDDATSLQDLSLNITAACHNREERVTRGLHIFCKQHEDALADLNDQLQLVTRKVARQSHNAKRRQAMYASQTSMRRRKELSMAFSGWRSIAMARARRFVTRDAASRALELRQASDLRPYFANWVSTMPCKDQVHEVQQSTDATMERIRKLMQMMEEAEVAISARDPVVADLIGRVGTR
eukprot:TRINITY_DN23842_c0_g1_i4.p1 TRINITY_DN23842_c0_g1~~TRINITY_DN23842_c0_g1_i4.p1  ORF type:complete len:240 (+),score=25.33 TRINITY_DN23842_c0_g1_i4:128-847(+)